MNAVPPNYALQKNITRAIRAVLAAGVEVGCVELAPDGAIRIFAKGEGEPRRDAFAEWQATRSKVRPEDLV